MHLDNLMKVPPRPIKHDHGPASVRCDDKIVCRSVLLTASSKNNMVL